MSEAFNQGFSVQPACPLRVVGDINAVLCGLLLQMSLQVLQQLGIKQLRLLWQLAMEESINQF